MSDKEIIKAMLEIGKAHGSLSTQQFVVMSDSILEYVTSIKNHISKCTQEIIESIEKFNKVQVVKWDKEVQDKLHNTKHVKIE